MNRKEQGHSNTSYEEDVLLINNYVKNSDNAAFNALVKKYKDMIFNLCFRILGEYNEADDCAQEVFIIMYEKLNTFQFKSAFSTWIYRIAVNNCKNHISSSVYKKVRNMIPIGPRNGESTIDIKDPHYDPVDIFEKSENEQIIHSAIQKLPGDLRVLIILRDLEGKSYEEIVQISGMKIGTVKSKLSRARRNLRDILKGQIL